MITLKLWILATVLISSVASVVVTLNITKHLINGDRISFLWFAMLWISVLICTQAVIAYGHTNYYP